MSNQLQLIFNNPNQQAALRPLRLYLAAMFVLGGLVLFSVNITTYLPDPDSSDHGALTIIGGVQFLIGIYMLLHKSMSSRTLHVLLTVGVLAVTACVVVARPLALVPVFYIWPMLVASYYLSRAYVVFNYAVFFVSFAVALAFVGEPDSRGMAFVLMALLIGVVCLIVVSLRERLQNAVIELQKAATHDSLTGTLNRAAFEQQLKLVSADSDKPYSLAILDLDYFKSINDQYGHSAGDEALKSFVNLISAEMRMGDVFARIGGEEFALMLPDGDLAKAVEFCEHLRALISEQTENPNFTVSIGVVSAGKHSPDRVLSAADEALYIAKKSGRNLVTTGLVREDIKPLAA